MTDLAAGVMQLVGQCILAEWRWRTAGHAFAHPLLADYFRRRSEVDLDVVMFIRSVIATIVKVPLVVDLAQVRRHRLPDGQITLLS